jgi:hypothetical protein
MARKLASRAHGSVDQGAHARQQKITRGGRLRRWTEADFAGGLRHSGEGGGDEVVGEATNMVLHTQSEMRKVLPQRKGDERYSVGVAH